MESILLTVKKFIGLDPEYNIFDPDLLILINSSFSVLNQLAVGPKEGFRVTNIAETWEDVIGSKKYLELIKEYICIKVKLVFDPPSSSNVYKAFEERAKELEWRLNAFEDRESVQEVIDAYSQEE